MCDDGDILAAFFQSRARVETWLANEMPGLDEEIRPTHFGYGGQTSRRPANEIANTERFAHFRARYSGSFSLYGKSFSLDFGLFDGVPCEISLWMSARDPRFVKHGPLLLESFDRCGADWAFAADWDEYAALHQYKMTYVDGGSGSGFIGKDFRRYVPGLYWLNYFSCEYMKQMQVDVQALSSRLGGVLSPLPRGMMLRLYDKPSDWRDRRQEVENVIHDTRNFFSMRNVHIPTNLSRKNPEEFLWSPGEQWP